MCLWNKHVYVFVLMDFCYCIDVNKWCVTLYSVLTKDSQWPIVKASVMTQSQALVTVRLCRYTVYKDDSDIKQNHTRQPTVFSLLLYTYTL